MPLNIEPKKYSCHSSINCIVSLACYTVLSVEDFYYDCTELFDCDVLMDCYTSGIPPEEKSNFMPLYVSAF